MGAGSLGEEHGQERASCGGARRVTLPTERVLVHLVEAASHLRSVGRRPGAEEGRLMASPPKGGVVHRIRLDLPLGVVRVPVGDLLCAN